MRDSHRTGLETFMGYLAQIIVLLSVAVAVVMICQRLRIPTSLGYLLVGVILGPATAGPSLNLPAFSAIAEFGVVFLLFTIGLNYSLPQLNALRHQVLGLGTAQVVFCTLVVGVLVWMAGVPGPAAFVIGAVFAQSSSTIIASLLSEQGEDSSPHGRLGLGMSVFQDVTAVPFLVIIPVLGVAADAMVIASNLGMAMAKAALAFTLVFVAGRWLLRPLFHQVARRRSAEVFTLAVLLVALSASWTTFNLGLSLAFGAFLAGMMLGETEFRHQIESSIRPFRDVLLGLFFVGIGMLIDPVEIYQVWPQALLGAALILVSKVVVVVLLVYRSGFDALTSWRVALILAVGGEFGFALLAIALESSVIEGSLGQIALASVLISMIVGAFLIKFNHLIAGRFAPKRPEQSDSLAASLIDIPEHPVIIGGFGRVGHTVAVLLQSKSVPYVAFDTDAERVRKAREDGFPVLYGDVSDPELLAAIRIERASLVVLTVDQAVLALRAVSYIRNVCPQVPVIVRARDLASSAQLMEMGATEAYPETIEASLRLGARALDMLNIPVEDIEAALQEMRDWNYQPLSEESTKSQ
jgi:monovalent cation:H+ antiporter-2, CPA2 family